MRFLMLLSLLFINTCTQTKTVVVHRSNCNVCHTPLQESATAGGLEKSHQNIDISCVTCHGGNDWICSGTRIEDDDSFKCDGDWLYDKTMAHVSPGTGTTFIKNLPGSRLDSIDKDYLQFINPGDFRVADRTCGVCHDSIVQTVTSSTMNHTMGELSIARYRAGGVSSAVGDVGAATLSARNVDTENACATGKISVFNPLEFSDVPYSDSGKMVAAAQDQYLVKACLRCHLSDFGENRFQGDFRSSGCTACHMEYSNEGFSKTKDPQLDHQAAPHPVSHMMTGAPTIQQCTHCHYRGARIGISYQGYRESAGPGHNPTGGEVLGTGLHGHDPNYYITDENASNTFDETPADIHFEAGMHCIDCHTGKEVHGDGHIYGDMGCAVNIQCSDCHGTASSYALVDDASVAVSEDNGRFVLTTKVSGLQLEVPQVKNSVTPSHSDYSELAERSMGVDSSGFSHIDELECYTCHSSWMPNCYGCHVELDMAQNSAYQTSGKETPGRPSGSRKWVVLNDLVLMKNSRGKIAPSMPAERFFMSITGHENLFNGQDHVSWVPRTFTYSNGRKIAGFGQRAVNPHTVRKRAQFGACDRCHSTGSVTAPANKTLLDISYGFGSERFSLQACNVTNSIDLCDESDLKTYQLDAIQTRAGQPLVVVGHDSPYQSRPLNVTEIEQMKSILVPADYFAPSSITEGSAKDPAWPYVQNLEE